MRPSPLRVASLHGMCSLPLSSILECEKLVKETYRRNGLVYCESSSEDEGLRGGRLSSEVIEIDDDDDDDVIAVGCCKLHDCVTATFYVCRTVKLICG